jgi:non-ribosomal peptide synthetase component E (peptide arylation enzyme)
MPAPIDPRILEWGGVTGEWLDFDSDATLPDLLTAAARQYPDVIAITDDGEHAPLGEAAKLTYAELLDKVRRVVSS